MASLLSLDIGITTFFPISQTGDESGIVGKHCFCVEVLMLIEFSEGYTVKCFF